MKIILLLLLATPLQAQWRSVKVSSVSDTQAINENFRRASLWSNRKVDRFSNDTIFGLPVFNQGIKFSDGTTQVSAGVVASTIAVNASHFTGNGATATPLTLKPILPALVDLSTVTSALSGKQATGNYITSLTGGITASGPGAAAVTIVSIPQNAVNLSTVTTAIGLKVNKAGDTMTDNLIVGASVQANLFVGDGSLLTNLSTMSATSFFAFVNEDLSTLTSPTTTVFTLTNTPVDNSLQLVENGIVLKSTDDYSLSGLTVTMVSTAPAGSTNFFAQYAVPSASFTILNTTNNWTGGETHSGVSTFTAQVNFSTVSLTTNGFSLLPNGLILQWGTGTMADRIDGTRLTITFPKAFPTAVIQVTASPYLYDNNNTWPGAYHAQTVSTTQAVIRQDNYANGSYCQTFYWQAIGY